MNSCDQSKLRLAISQFVGRAAGADFIEGWNSERMFKEAGNGGQEIRDWLVAADTRRQCADNRNRLRCGRAPGDGHRNSTIQGEDGRLAG
jgi:hypothetical protein